MDEVFIRRHPHHAADDARQIEDDFEKLISPHLFVKRVTDDDVDGHQQQRQREKQQRVSQRDQNFAVALDDFLNDRIEVFKGEVVVDVLEREHHRIEIQIHVEDEEIHDGQLPHRVGKKPHPLFL